MVDDSSPPPSAAFSPLPLPPPTQSDERLKELNLQPLKEATSYSKRTPKPTSKNRRALGNLENSRLSSSVVDAWRERRVRCVVRRDAESLHLIRLDVSRLCSFICVPFPSFSHNSAIVSSFKTASIDSGHRTVAAASSEDTAKLSL